MSKFDNTTLAWSQYEAGRQYRLSAGMYDASAENERFYRGDQWNGVNTQGLGTPVFNIIRRVTDYMISSIMAHRITVSYTDEQNPYTPEGEREHIAHSVELLGRYAAYRFNRSETDVMLRDSLLDAAISGDAVFYTWWDAQIRTGQPYSGDFRTVLIDPLNLTVADNTLRDIQRQDYVILRGRTSVSRLKAEAAQAGADEETLKLIIPDSPDEGSDEGDADQSVSRADFVIKFYRSAAGSVCWEKCTRAAVIRRAETSMKLYPLVHYCWTRVKNRFNGYPLITPMKGNQKYINKAYAMAMKHMTDTAFSKVIYDKKLIPEWSNEVGQAIGVMAGGDVSNAVHIVGCGEMEGGFTDILDSTIRNTKELYGATDAALGETSATNTSAILALQESSEIPLENIRINLYGAVEALAAVWAEFICAYYTDGRLVSYASDEGMRCAAADFKRLSDRIISAHIDVGEATRFSKIAVMATLDKLLSGGYITIAQYLRRLPDGVIPERDALIAELAGASNKEDKITPSETSSIKEDNTALSDTNNGEEDKIAPSDISETENHNFTSAETEKEINV
ncbi:MAG: hypothetical protein WCQ72_08330 [Eubacteriales bacterium]